MQNSVVEQLYAIALAELAGYSFNASDLVISRVLITTNELEYEVIDNKTGYRYFINARTGVVTSNAPRQIHII